MHNQQNTQLAYLHSLLTYLIGLLTLSLLGVVQCRCNQTSETSKKLEITVSKTCLRAPETEFEVIVKPAEGDFLSSLKDLKLKAQFWEQETLAGNGQENYLAHKHTADRQIFTTGLLIPLTEYTTAIESASDSTQEQNELRIPMVLRASNQATRLKIGIELLDTLDKVLDHIEVIWVKNELLISDLTTLGTPEGMVSLTLKNTKDIPLKTNNLILNLTSGNLESVIFSQTNTSQATLEQLWDRCTTLAPGAKTSPIFLKLNKKCATQAFSNVTITVNQEGNHILATKTLPWPHIQPSLDPLKQKEEPAQMQKKEKQQEPQLPTTLPHLQIKVVHTTNKKFTLFVENTGQKISKKLLQLVNLKYSIEGTGDIKNVKFKRGSVADINEVSLAELLKSGLQEGQTKELEVILEPGNADSLHIDFSLKGTQDHSLVTCNWEKKQKPIKKEETVEKNEVKSNEVKSNEIDKPLKEKSEKLDVELALAVPNLYMNTKASDKSPKIFKLIITNQGENISEDTLKNVKLHYTLEGTDDLTTTYLKRRGNPTDINERPLLDFIKSGFSKNQTKEFELIIETGNAKTLTIHLALEGIQNGNTAMFSWINKEKLKAKIPAKDREALQGDQQGIQKNNTNNLPSVAEQVLNKEKAQVQELTSNVQEELKGTLKEEEIKTQESIEKEILQERLKNYEALNQALLANLEEDLKAAAADYEATREILKKQEKNQEKEKNWWQRFLYYKK